MNIILRLLIKGGAIPSPFALCALLFAIIASSCGGLSLSPERDILSHGPSLYCDLLHIPSGDFVYRPRPFLGVSVIPKELEQEVPPCKNKTFPQVSDVMAGAPAMKSGVAKDDIILSVNGRELCLESGDAVIAFKKVIGREKVGARLDLTVLRGNSRVELSPELVEMPLYRQEEAAHRYDESCANSAPSELEKALTARSDLPVFREVLSGLHLQSKAVQNTAWFERMESNPFQTKEFTYLMGSPLTGGEAAKELSEGLTGLFEKEDLRLGEIVKRSARLIDADFFTPEGRTAAALPELLRIMGETKERVEGCLDRLTHEERELLREKALNPWEDDRWETVLEVSLKVDRSELFGALSTLLSFLDRDNLMRLREDLLKRFGDRKEPILFETTMPMGKVIVGGPGPNIHVDDAALILDLGGDDLYLNNAGGTRPGMPVAIVIDWEGDDRYISRENYSQGAGLMGGGFLIDLSGKDTFISLDGSQGAGFWGIGLLHHGAGNGIYRTRSLSQGVGQAGIGILLSGEGNDFYECSFEGQALGLFGGAGILIDGSGDDSYQLGGLKPDFRDASKSTVSMGQGFGLGIRPEQGKGGVSGGIGMLIDKEGNDAYHADYFAQGSSYYYGSGILDDRAGNDEYIAGRYAQGAGIHSSVGILIDRKGNDFYYSSFGVAQGMGHDFGLGFFEDDGGDDRYFGGILVQGAATRGGIGILIDGSGKDHYIGGAEGQAYAADEDCSGILIDMEPERDIVNLRGEPEVVRIGMKP